MEKLLKHRLNLLYPTLCPQACAPRPPTCTSPFSALQQLASCVQSHSRQLPGVSADPTGEGTVHRLPQADASQRRQGPPAPDQVVMGGRLLSALPQPGEFARMVHRAQGGKGVTFCYHFTIKNGRNVWGCGPHNFPALLGRTTLPEPLCAYPQGAVCSLPAGSHGGATVGADGLHPWPQGRGSTSSLPLPEVRGTNFQLPYQCWSLQ